MRYNRLFQDTNHSVPPTDYTDQLANYLADLRYEDLPEEVVERAKFILLQTIGVSLAAYGTDIAQKADALALEANGGTGGAVTRWLKGGTLSPANAGLLAGTVSDALDWEDCSWTGHPSAGIIPAAVIAAEEKHRSGKDLITAIVGAYEVYQRIALAAQPGGGKHKKGWGLTSWQIFGVVAAAAKLYGFDARKIDQAIGMAVEISTIPACYHETTMSDFYHYEHGYRVRDGLLIVKEVEKGIHNQRGALDDNTRAGYLNCITDEPKPEWLTKDLGRRYLILETLLKHWPANMWVQSPLEAVAQIVEEHAVRAEDVEEVIVDPGTGDRMWASGDGFTSVTHAQFSIPYVVASYLLDHTPGAQWYRRENLTRPDIVALALRVHGGPSPVEYPSDGFRQFQKGEYPLKTVTVRTKDGKEYVAEVDRHPGHPGNMFTRRQISDRFRVQAALVLQGERLEAALDTLLHVERVADAAQLGQYLYAQN